jgi:hypothetical protein
MFKSKGIVPDIAKIVFNLLILFIITGLVVIGLLLLSIFIWKSISLSIVFGICLLVQLFFTFKMFFPSETIDID